MDAQPPPTRKPLPAPPSSAFPPSGSPNLPSPTATAYEALYGDMHQCPPSAALGSPPPVEWRSTSMRGGPGGGTFFVSGSGTQRMTSSRPSPPRTRPPLPGRPSFGQSRGMGAAPAPHFTVATSYSPPLESSGYLPPGAGSQPPLCESQPQQEPACPTAGTVSTTKVPLATSSSILLHNGFWELLSTTGSRFLAPLTTNVAPSMFADDTARANELGVGQAWNNGIDSSGVARADAPSEAIRRTGKKRVSVGMISRPKDLQHLVHASDHEQAQLLLTRWHLDGLGKLGSSAWAAPLKEAVRSRARAKGVAEVQAYRAHESAQTDLKVVNGLPESAFTTTSSNVAVEDEDGEESSTPAAAVTPAAASPSLRQASIPFFARSESKDTFLDRGEGLRSTASFPEGGTTKFTRGAWDRPAPDGTPKRSPISFDRPGMLKSIEGSPPPSSPTGSDKTISFGDDDFGMPRSFVPSLSTIEKAASTKIYFETKYFNILRKPRDRDQRRDLLEAELARLNISDSQRNNVRAAWALSETEYLRDMRNKAQIGSFIKLKTIGHGAFGVVSLVKERGTGELFAMKQLRKADMLRKGQEGHVRAERDLLAAASTSTRWAVRLAYSFQDVDHLYLVMTFMAGGDLLTLLIERDTFSESMARFYIAEMILAVSETHRVLGAIHRDIKPDNFLFSSDGHIAISDFGLAHDFHWAHDGAYYDQQRQDLLRKHGIDLTDGARAPATKPFDEDQPTGSILAWRDRNRRRAAFSVVGTNNYMAVEVLRGYGYDQAADWWSLGVILYEMLYGYPPFVSKSRQITRQKIANWKTTLRFPAQPRISREAQDLIASLICEREDRLGSRSTASVSRPNSTVINQRRGSIAQPQPAGSAGGVQADGVEEIMAHPFFRGVDWATLHLQTPPFVPKLASSDDTRYFEDDIDDSPLTAPEIAPGVPAPDTTRDPMLRHPEEGARLLEVRKATAFQGWTYKKPKRQVYDPRRGLQLGVKPDTGTVGHGARGRSLLRVDTTSSFKRSLSV